MKRRIFLTKGTAGVFALGAVGCSHDKLNPLASSSKTKVISGMIADPEGNGVQNILVTLAGGEGSKSAYTDKTGKFSFEVLKSGEYTIYPCKEGYNFNPVSQKLAITDSSESNSFVINIMAILINSGTYSEIPTGKLGTTDVTVSKFAFGSHYMHSSPTLKDPVEREYTIRQAFDRGVTTFDIYNKENGYYQYEPMSKYLAPILNDVQISVAVNPENNRTYEEEFEHMLELFNRDSFDMVRLRANTPGSAEWNFWERLFELRDEGKVRAIGVAIHTTDGLDKLLEVYGDELDYVFFPYNFYHNKWWSNQAWSSEGYIPFAQTLRDRGIGVVVIKPFAGDYWIPTLKEAAGVINQDISFTQACLRYVLNTGLNPDTTFAGMNHFRDFDENIKAYLEPEMSEEETKLLNDVKGVAEKIAHLVLPDHYKFLNDWVPERSHLGKNNVGIKYS